MTTIQLVFASTALRELYFISNKPKEVIDKFISDSDFSVFEIRNYLSEMTIEKYARQSNMFGSIDLKTAREMLNRNIVAFNIYFPEQMTGKINHIVAANRLIQGLTQKEIAEKIDIRNATISDFEAGKYNLGSDKLEAIMNVLNLTISKLPDAT